MLRDDADRTAAFPAPQESGQESAPVDHPGPQDQEGNIVDALRSNGAASLSLVATLDGRVVGHIMYSPASVEGGVTGAALGPMAVHPAHQRQGIGTKLVEAGNRKLKDTGYPFIIVVGHAEYYPRFGFKGASSHGITCEWELPDDVFMLLVLPSRPPGARSGCKKLVLRDEPHAPRQNAPEMAGDFTKTLEGALSELL